MTSAGVPLNEVISQSFGDRCPTRIRTAKTGKAGSALRVLVDEVRKGRSSLLTAQREKVEFCWGKGRMMLLDLNSCTTKLFLVNLYCVSILHFELQKWLMETPFR